MKFYFVEKENIFNRVKRAFLTFYSLGLLCRESTTYFSLKTKFGLMKYQLLRIYLAVILASSSSTKPCENVDDDMDNGRTFERERILLLRKSCKQNCLKVRDFYRYPKNATRDIASYSATSVTDKPNFAITLPRNSSLKCRAFFIVFKVITLVSL
ncbi:hypothetical protein [Bartonella henselae]|uniref:Uncharacterized protein n=1 Tax=Bartonella henselae (strain ATCC 49882 / DSM 28221 / CCUG 30454 / Houston 1) TaxID=283166 RepID=A0A0H3LY07_BARHE|nr:hypothetical protein [Bartonella henselae]ETS04920.1 hypothetical protein Q654_01491 [Bartonella henselae JK 50]ETS05966.1 hypothetical protein Q655_01437 [Bartonella henselae JK 51]ETS10796.1 hypothetical protein Q653_00517 [Bartonella henselae JK 42]ETS12957.1 hypothetical protein Q652_00648 [Bartonella henselae JK 41]KEC58944.1 hypothetical protein O97_00125 [Bartonella henselae str. Zeus]